MVARIVLIGLWVGLILFLLESVEVEGQGASPLSSHHGHGEHKKNQSHLHGLDNCGRRCVKCDDEKGSLLNDCRNKGQKCDDIVKCSEALPEVCCGHHFFEDEECHHGEGECHHAGCIKNGSEKYGFQRHCDFRREDDFCGSDPDHPGSDVTFCFCWGQTCNHSGRNGGQSLKILGVIVFGVVLSSMFK